MLSVRLTPKSSGDRLEGLEHLANGRQVFKARVRALPEAGKANAALIRLLAETLGVAAAKITVEAGASSRIKTLRIAGDPEALAQRLAPLTIAAGRGGGGTANVPSHRRHPSCRL